MCNPPSSTPCLRSLLFFNPNIRTLEKMSTRFPLHSPCFLPGLFRRRWVVGRWACCSLAWRFCRIKPLAIAAAMAQPIQKQPCLRPRLQSLQLCPPEGTERRRNQTQTSSLRLPAITAPYFSHNAVKSKKNKKIYIKKIINHTASRYCIFSAADILLAIDLKRTAVYLSVTFHRSVCQSGNSSCHWTAPPNNLSTPRSSVRAPMVNGQLKKNIWKTQQCLRKQLRPLLWKAPVCIPLTEARGARAAGASPSSCAQPTRFTRSITGKRAVCLSKWKPPSPLRGSKWVVRINEPLDGKENKNI